MSDCHPPRARSRPAASSGPRAAAPGAANPCTSSQAAKNRTSMAQSSLRRPYGARLPTAAGRAAPARDPEPAPADSERPRAAAAASRLPLQAASAAAVRGNSSVTTPPRRVLAAAQGRPSGSPATPPPPSADPDCALDNSLTMLSQLSAPELNQTLPPLYQPQAPFELTAAPILLQRLLPPELRVPSPS